MLVLGMIVLFLVWALSAIDNLAA